MYKGKMTVIAHGRELELYTIGEAAKRLKRSVETLRAWERNQIMPKPMYKNKNVRLYHPLEVEAMKKALKKAGKGAKKVDLQRELWTALTQIRKEILEEVEGTNESNDVR